jgi:hypothetical protein
MPESFGEKMNLTKYLFLSKWDNFLLLFSTEKLRRYKLVHVTKNSEQSVFGRLRCLSATKERGRIKED